MGEKGVRTRKRLLDATETLLRTRPLLELSVADIAKTAETSPATFYLYFSDVSVAVLGVISQYTQSTPALMSLAASVGRGGEDADLRAQEFVQAYIAHWRNYGPLFRVRNLAADEGDERFVLVRSAAVRPLLNLIAQMVRRNQTPDGPTAHLDPIAAGGALLSMIDRLAVTPNYTRENVPGATTVQSVGRAASYYLSVLVGAPVNGRQWPAKS
jgi:AcrR family transcriptional regulator